MTQESKIYSILCDVDGVLLYQTADFTETLETDFMPGIPGSREKLRDWHCLGYRIILTTGRPSTLRDLTERQLLNAGIIYDQLIMDCGSGPRVLINDAPFDSPAKAQAINVVRNTGLTDIII